MNTLSSAPALGSAPLLRRLPLRGVLAFDAATGLIMGLLLSLMPLPLSAWLGLPVALLVGMVVFGNVAWVAASVLVLVLMGPTVLGAVFVTGQAVAVAALAWVEWQLRAQAR